MGKRYLVTGASSGIGRATAQTLLQQGHTVVAVDINAVDIPVEQTIQADLTQEGVVADITKQLNGKFDGICNIAGLPPLEGREPHILAINYRAAVELTLGMFSQLSPNASIVNLASRAGAQWRDNIEQVKALHSQHTNQSLEAWVANEQINAAQSYVLSKEALIAWTLANSEDFSAKGFRINSVSPSAISTGILDDFAKAFGEKMAKNVERAGRPGTAQEVADVICFMLSDNSHWIRGLDLWVDGGMSAFQQKDHLGLNDLCNSSA